MAYQQCPPYSSNLLFWSENTYVVNEFKNGTRVMQGTVQFPNLNTIIFLICGFATHCHPRHTLAAKTGTGLAKKPRIEQACLFVAGL
jgi:hypothetical protein